MEEKRMETVQSFDAQFEEEPHIVLLNFKNLLFSLRWNRDLTINYLQWLITVVNDCVYYFIKHSEPIYAFHTLVIAEFYIKKILHKSSSDKGLFDLGSIRPQKRKKIQKPDTKVPVSFSDYITRMCDPT